MTGAELILRLRATLAGPLARRALSVGAQGRVGAVFERSFYIGLGQRWVCVGAQDLGAGPLNLLLEPWPAGRPLRASVGDGDAVTVTERGLSTKRLKISLAGARRWRPEPPPAFTAQSLARGLAATSALLRTRRPQDGLGLGHGLSLVCSGPMTPGAVAPLRELARLLRCAAAGEPYSIAAPAIAPLIGLGPGLTPSGDDYLGGVLVALSSIGGIRFRDQFWHALEPDLNHGTTDISRAHLAAAAEGLGCAALHACINAILSGRQDLLPDAITALTGMGHSSGSDMLAGALCVLRTAAEATNLARALPGPPPRGCPRPAP
jgi:hypothetical protein